MDTFKHIEGTLSELEASHFQRLAFAYKGDDELRSSLKSHVLTGGVQFAGLDLGGHPKPADVFHYERTENLPVVCTVGINYTQGGPQSEDGLFHYLQKTLSAKSRSRSGPYSESLVVQNLPRLAVAHAIAGYNRNRSAWTTPSALELGTYAPSVDALPKDLLWTDDAQQMQHGFILIMTNLCPFITQKKWQHQATLSREACEYLVRPSLTDSYLDDLFDRLGLSVDLWIGHSAIDGNEWVWPGFSGFIKHHQIRQWLFTPNISGVTVANFNGHFRNAKNKRFHLFGPEE